MTTQLTMAICFGLACALALVPGMAAATSAPDYVRVRAITYAGSGCPAGSVAKNISPDKQAFTLLFDEYVAEAGPGVLLAAGRKNCAINIDLDFPQGWSFTIFDVDYRGYVLLDRNVTGTQKSSYYFQGGTGPSLAATLYGPQNKDYHYRDTLLVTAEVWSPCGATRSLNINSQVRVDNTRNRFAQGLMTVDSIDGQLTHIYGLKWRRC